jgi:DNA-binding CsgD family transcriptional regulator
MKIIQDTVLTSKNNKSKLDSGFLTSRELEVLQLICDQKTTIEIGEKLFISPRTVEGHRNNLLLKTESRNIAGLVVFAIQNEIASITI